MIYRVRKAAAPPTLDDDFSADRWSAADIALIGHFHPRSSDHRPLARCKVLYDERSLYLLFHVHDRYVRAIQSGYQAPVCRDSCVEFFVQPREGKGYFNFEFNCGASLLLYYIEDASRVENAPFARYVPIPESIAATVKIRSSLPSRVEPEMTHEIDWTLACEIPLALFEPFVGPVTPSAGEHWRANFFKCGDETSHPHWASWSPIGETLRFHQPDKFGVLQFVD